MRENIVAKVKEAGVVGAGGAGFPTHVKVDATVDTVIVNGASCEPLLMSDPYLLENEIDLVISGVKAVMECTGAKKAYICLKGKHTEAMKVVAEGVEKAGVEGLQLFELKDFYPAGDEHVLVREVTGKSVPEAGIPLQVGVVVSNVESLLNIANSMNDKPLTHRYLTVAGEVGNPMVLKVPIGSLVGEIIEFAGGTTVTDYKVVDGGPMMGKVLPDLNQPVTKTTSGILVFPSDHNVVASKLTNPEKIKKIAMQVCCQCSLCTDLCPRNLLGHNIQPHKLMRSLNAPADENLEIRKQALLCSECGICEKFACPMMISPREVNALIKKNLMAEGIRYQSEGLEPVNNPFMELRHIPTKRLMARLDVLKYDTHPVSAEKEFTPSCVEIPLSQHIGAPAVAVVSEGDSVKTGDVIGEIPENALGARVHASINGVVKSVLNGIVKIAVS